MPKTELRCPICGQAMYGDWTEWPEYPFCSRRCRQIDLGRWLGEAYRIPVTRDEPEPDADPDAPTESV